jgi:hypothetical protein
MLACNISKIVGGTSGGVNSTSSTCLRLSTRPWMRRTCIKLALREDMSRGGTLAERLAWLEGLGFDGIELSAAALDLPPRELEEIFADSPVRAENRRASGRLGSTSSTSTSPTATASSQGKDPSIFYQASPLSKRLATTAIWASSVGSLVPTTRRWPRPPPC